MGTNPTLPPPHFLVTAGPTRERIDEVRDWGNIFTGRTGLDLALAFLDLGNVTLLTSNREHAREFDGYSGKGGMLGAETFSSHADLQDLLEERMAQREGAGKVDVVAMTAAVADYRPEGVYRIVEKRVEGGGETWRVENVSAGKVKSHYDQIAVLGARTVKLIDRFRTDWQFTGILIKFKLEVGLGDGQLIEVATASRLASKADLMVANTLAMARPKVGKEGGGYMIDDGGAKWVERRQLAVAIKSWVAEKLTPAM